MPGIETSSTIEHAMSRPAATRLATRMNSIMRGKSVSSTVVAFSAALASDLAIFCKMDPATLSVFVDGLDDVVLEVGSGVSSMENAEGGASVVGGGAGAVVDEEGSSSQEGASPSMMCV